MTMAGPERTELTISRTQQYREAIMPYVVPAREAFHRMRETRQKLGLTGGKTSSDELKYFPALRKPCEGFRLEANQLIAEVNKWRMRQPGVTALTVRPQIPPPKGSTPFQVPESPVRPHNALDQLPIYRKRRTGSDVASLVPGHLLVDNSKDLAKLIAGIANTVDMYNAGLLQPPTAEELGKRSPEQEQHVITYLRVLLAYYLADELANPNRTEAELRDFYQSLSNDVRKTARFITPRDRHERDSYERIGLLIERLPGLEGPMLASRLSTSLFQDLGLPCLDYMGEIRLAEVMRNICSSCRYSPVDRADMTMDGYIVPENYRLLLEKIIESINERLDSGEINCQRVFVALETLDYGEQLMNKLLEIAGYDGQGVLLRALSESDCFPDIKRGIREE